MIDFGLLIKLFSFISFNNSGPSSVSTSSSIISPTSPKSLSQDDENPFDLFLLTLILISSDFNNKFLNSFFSFLSLFFL